MIGAMYPWALRPALIQRLDEYDLYNYGPDGTEYTNDDEYDYYGSAVSESWFTRWENASNADWQGSTVLWSIS